MHKKEFDILKDYIRDICNKSGFSVLKTIPYLSDNKDKYGTKYFECAFANALNGTLNPNWEDHYSNLVDGDVFVDIIDDYGHMHHFKIDVKVADEANYDTAGISDNSLNSFSGGYYCLFNSQRTKFKLVSRENIYNCLVNGSRDSYLDKGLSSFNLNSDYISSRINYEYYYI